VSKYDFLLIGFDLGKTESPSDGNRAVPLPSLRVCGGWILVSERPGSPGWKLGGQRYGSNVRPKLHDAFQSCDEKPPGVRVRFSGGAYGL
jgi:hypothetical protein